MMQQRTGFVRAALWLTLPMVSFALVGCQSTGHNNAPPVTKVLTADAQKAMTPAQVVADLRAGNERFAAAHGTKFDYNAQVQQTAAGQYPKAVILSCLDSRVPPEIVFDQGIGDVFVGRVAGNFENVDMLGSMEFATAVAGAKAIVVLGHTACGAVKGAADQAKLGNLTATLENIQPAVEEAKAAMPGQNHTAKNAAFVQAVADANVRRTVRDIAARSTVLAERIAKGELVVVGGMYDLATGRVTWLD